MCRTVFSILLKRALGVWRMREVILNIILYIVLLLAFFFSSTQ